MSRSPSTTIVVFVVALAAGAAFFFGSRGVSPKTASSAAVHGQLPLLRLSAAQDPQSLDPAKLVDTESSVFVTAQFAPLCLVAPGEVVIPILAESIDSAPDGRTVRIRLRENAVFSDGSPVRAADVRFTFERLYARNHPQRFVVDRIVGIETADLEKDKHADGLRIEGERDLVVTLDPPDPCWAKLTATAFCGIIKEGSDRATARPLDAHLIGAGPFVLDTAQPGGTYHFKGNPGFPLHAPAASLDITVLANEQEALNRASAGGFDLVRVRGNQLHGAIQTSSPSGSTVSALPNLRVLTAPADDLVFLLVNWKGNPFSAMTLEQLSAWRARLSKHIDRDALVASVYHGLASSADRPIRDGAAPIQASVADGWSGVSSIELMTPPLGELRQVSDRIQADLREAGLELSVRLVSINDFIARLGKSDFQFAVLWLESNISEPTLSWATFFQEGGAASLFGDPLPFVASALGEARGLPLGAERDKALRKLASDINSRQMRVIPLVNRAIVFLAGDAIESPGIDRNGIMHLSLLKTRTRSR